MRWSSTELFNEPLEGLATLSHQESQGYLSAGAVGALFATVTLTKWRIWFSLPARISPAFLSADGAGVVHGLLLGVRVSGFPEWCPTGVRLTGVRFSRVGQADGCFVCGLFNSGLGNCSWFDLAF